MEYKVTTGNQGKQEAASEEDLNLIEHHNIVAKHYEQAAKYRRQAARFHEAGEHDKAYDSVLKSHRHAYLASEAQRNETKLQTLTA
jgi:hypothetical protein